MFDVESEIVGSVWKVFVAEGQRVNAGEALLVLESMKMEIGVESPVSGLVRAIHVSEGEQIAEGTPLMSIDPT